MHQSHSQSTAAEQESSGVMNDIQKALSSAWGRVGLGLATIGLLVGAEGCSPKARSYWSGTFVEIPAPPAEARLQLNTSTESDGDVFVNYVVWDAKANSFLRKDIHYTFTSGLNPIPMSNFREAGGYQQAIKDGEVLTNGAIVDQKAGKILIGDGLYVDGPSGNIMNSTGELVKALAK